MNLGVVRVRQQLDEYIQGILLLGYGTVIFYTFRLSQLSGDGTRLLSGASV